MKKKNFGPIAFVGCSLKSFQSLPKQIPYFDIPTNFYETTKVRSIKEDSCAKFISFKIVVQ